MVYAELKGKSLDKVVYDLFGLHLKEIPKNIVICPFNFNNIFGKKWIYKIKRDGFEIKRIKIPDHYFGKIGKNLLVEKRKLFFCIGGRGASDFADSAFLLCRIPQVKKIIFVGTAAGIGKNITPGIHIPLSCKRLEKVLEVLIPMRYSAKADKELFNQIHNILTTLINDSQIKIYTGIHATVPFFFCETRELLLNLQKEGFLSVDMELSVLYTLANFYGKRTCGILRVFGDMPLQKKEFWKKNIKLKKDMMNVMLSCIIRLFF